MVKVATGSASVTKVFGLGKNDALMFQAKKDMMQNYPLKEGQSFANITVDTSHSAFLIFNTEKITVTADVVEFK
jgi:hypothetical protein